MKIIGPCIGFAVICMAYQAQAAHAQAYPTKSVRYIVASLPGGGGDIIGRLVAVNLSQTFHQQVVVDNRAGGGQNIGAEIAARAAPDGHTIFQMAVTHVINASLYRNLSYDIVRDFAPVTRLASTPLIIVAHPSLQVKSISELVNVAKAKPGSINYASGGTGTPTYLAAELFKQRAGIDLVHVPYKGGGGAQTSVLAGETSVYFANISTALPHFQSGRLRGLAVTSTERIPLLPDYPTVAESGYPGYQSETWFGQMLPIKTPAHIVATLRNATLAALGAADVNTRLRELAFVAVGDRSDEFASYIRSEVALYSKLVSDLRVSPD
jgi:tripartite-type tricarboxylate transporter receptor subunit TctC